MVRAMLHLRRHAPPGRAPSGLQSAGLLLLTLWDRIAAADPGLLRLTMAVRGTLSVLLTTLAAVAASRYFGFAPFECASGITLSLMMPFLMREPTLRQRQRTLVVLALPAMGATVATSLLHGYGVIGDSWFLVLVFVCFVVHPLHPRLIGAGLVAVVITYIGLYLELPPATLPLQLAAIALAVPIIAFACFVVLPMNPAATLRRAVAAVQGRAAQVLGHAREVAETQAPPEAALARLRRDLGRLNEAALAADDQLPLLEPQGREAVRAGLIDIELATARLVDALREAPAEGLRGNPRHAMRLKLHERRMRRGRAYHMNPGQFEPGTLLAALVDLGQAVHRLGVAAGAIAPGREPAVSSLPPGPLAWRLATRVTLAAALAMAGGMALSPQRWFWAVITVYLVFLNARTRGDTIYKGMQRLGGTLLGIVSGLILATATAGHLWLQVAVLLASVFGMYYWILISYTIGIFSVTIMLGLIYGLLGAPLESVLLLRLEETAIGAVAAFLVAGFVLPTPTREQVIRSGRGVLAALVDAVRACRVALEGATPAGGAAPAADPMLAMRRVDRQVADLRLALTPLIAGRALLRRAALERPVPALLDCVHWTRVLAAASPAPEADATALAAQAARIEARLAALAGVACASTPAAALPAPHSASAAGAALQRLEVAVALLAERLEIGALEGFALDS
jgi:hypothetical protein